MADPPANDADIREQVDQLATTTDQLHIGAAESQRPEGIPQSSIQTPTRPSVHQVPARSPSQSPEMPPLEPSPPRTFQTSWIMGGGSAALGHGLETVFYQISQAQRGMRASVASPQISIPPSTQGVQKGKQRDMSATPQVSSRMQEKSVSQGPTAAMTSAVAAATASGSATVAPSALTQAPSASKTHSAGPPPHEPRLPRGGSPLSIRRTSMHVGGIWDRLKSTIVSQVYVEKLEPLNSSERFSIPVILVHGDYHDGTIWHQKPDGGRGWAEWFAGAGFTVFLPDLPFHGRSKLDNLELVDRIQYMDATVIENELTAPEKSTVHNAYYYETAQKHNQWPGNAKRGDPIFDNYIQRLYPEHYDRRVRQIASQYAIFDLLRQTGPAILIGQGMGGNIAMLGLDSKPELVRAVIAVEPAGPPFSSATKLDEFGNRIHLNEPEYTRSLRAHGISDVPVNYDPPANVSLKSERGDIFEEEEENELPPIPVAKFFDSERKMSCYLQDPDLVLAADSFTMEDGRVEHHEFMNPIRTLTNISQKPVAIVTTEASPHALYDWATVAFLKQAGVRVTHLELSKHGIHGNGHLCFLEKNSDDIANLLFRWIVRTIPSIVHNAYLPEEQRTMAGMNQYRSIITQQIPMQGAARDRQPVARKQGSEQPSVFSTPTQARTEATHSTSSSPADAIRRRRSGSNISVQHIGQGRIAIRWAPSHIPEQPGTGGPGSFPANTPIKQTGRVQTQESSPSPVPRLQSALMQGLHKATPLPASSTAGVAGIPAQIPMSRAPVSQLVAPVGPEKSSGTESGRGSGPRTYTPLSASAAAPRVPAEGVHSTAQFMPIGNLRGPNQAVDQQLPIRSATPFSEIQGQKPVRPAGIHSLPTLSYSATHPSAPAYKVPTVAKRSAEHLDKDGTTGFPGKKAKILKLNVAGDGRKTSEEPTGGQQQLARATSTPAGAQSSQGILSQDNSATDNGQYGGKHPTSDGRYGRRHSVSDERRDGKSTVHLTPSKSQVNAGPGDQPAALSSSASQSPHTPTKAQSKKRSTTSSSVGPTRRRGPYMTKRKRAAMEAATQAEQQELSADSSPP